MPTLEIVPGASAGNTTGRPALEILPEASAGNTSGRPTLEILPEASAGNTTGRPALKILPEASAGKTAGGKRWKYYRRPMLKIQAEAVARNISEHCRRRTHVRRPNRASTASAFNTAGRANDFNTAGIKYSRNLQY